MFFIFGTNRYTLKSVEPEELGIAREFGGIQKFELVQRFVHFCFIPVFPIGSQWCARKADRKLYTINGPILEALNNIPYSKAAIIPAFSGLILLLLFWIFSRVI